MSATTADHELDRADGAALLDCQTEVLELMSAGASLPVMLDRITSRLETLMPASQCSVLLLDPATGTLRHGSAPSLPADYLAAIDGLVPAPFAGSCGSAAFHARAFVAADVTVDDRWPDYRDAAAQAGLRACWSTPILRNGREVVGTFAVYHRDVHVPTAREELVVDRLTYLASVVIAHARTIGALMVSEERFRRAFEDNAVGMALLDTDGRCTQVNGALLALVGIGAADVVRARLSSMVSAADSDRFEALFDGVCAGRERSANAEVVLVRPDGTEAVVAMTLSLVRGAQAEPLQVSVSMRDITERLAARQERQARQEAELARRAAEAASGAKSAFLSAVSHEMRTPLQAITGFAELLGTLDLDAERRRAALAHITAGATHLLELVDDTLDLSRIEAGALPLTVEPLDVADLLAEVVQFLAPVAERHAVTLVAEGATGAVAADRRRLRQVLINLVGNGIRYSGPGGVVRVGTHDGAITVADDGPGIPAWLRERLFEPFVHVDPPADARVTAAGSRAGESEGMGLGLMLARGLTEAMAGTLTLGDAPRGGTLATVRVPPA